MRKSGILSNIEIDYITCHYQTLSLAEICTELNRNPGIVARFMKENGLDSAELNIHEDEKQRLKLRKILQAKYYFPNIKSQLIMSDESDEIELYINKWIDMMVQFREDVLSLEEAQMNELILLSINMERVRRQEAKNLMRISALEKKLELEYQFPVETRNEDLPRWETELMMARTSATSYISQIKNINTDVNKINYDLKATRDQRFKKIESDAKTFQNLIRKLQDDTIRATTERGAELMKMATEKQREKLYDFHQYEGGDGLDIPILNHVSAAKLKDKN